MSTKKVKSTGRYGARYGVGIRKRLIKVEEKQKRKHSCPDCGFKKVSRRAAGIFSCRKCGLEFAGGAYFPETLTGNIVKKTVSQKAFASIELLLAGKEKTQ
ncbi:MAG TPA: 50S ribosomal protein L37ae [archaeon]|nr:50S ribosomal protein L37ae [archaeon]